jgi:adenylate kinase
VNPLVAFLGGPPGAGKSTLAAAVVQARPCVRVVTAGNLIHAGLGRSGCYVRPPVADHARAAFFQNVLVSEFERVRETHPGDWLIDGHYAVPTGAGPSRIPADVFHRLGCKKLLVVEVEVSVLVHRLRARGGADWWDGSSASVKALVEADRAQAHAVAMTLGLDLTVVGTAQDLLEVLNASP